MKIRCDYCDKEYSRSPAEIKRAKKHYCSKKCLGLDRRGKVRPEAARLRDKHPQWKGDSLKRYRMIVINGKRILEHRYIMESFLGRNLESLEEVHHINGNKLDNNIDNLCVLSKSDHARLHQDIRAGRL